MESNSICDKKIVFLQCAGIAGLNEIKKYLKIELEDNDRLALDFCIHTVLKSSSVIKLKLYLVSNVSKFKELQPLYFKNATVAIIVIEAGKPYPIEIIKEMFTVFNSNNSAGEFHILQYSPNKKFDTELMENLCKNGIKASVFNVSNAEGIQILLEKMAVIKNIKQINQIKN